MRAFVRVALVLALGLASAVGQSEPAGEKPVAGQGAALQVAFTFDDLPAHGPLPPGMARPAVVQSILATLQREHMPPVYGFVNGFRVAQFPYQIHILQAWRAAGQPLGNHTWSHPELDKLTAAQYERNIAADEEVLRRADPHGDWHWFRYPFLEEGNTVAKREQVRGWLSAHQYRVAEVSMDFQDYLWNEPYARCATRHDEAAIQVLHDSYLATAATDIDAYRKLAKELYGHDIPYVLLMHVGAFDASMLPELIALFRSRGFAFIPLPQAMADPVYREDPKVPVPGGTTFNEMVATRRNAGGPDVQEPEAMLDHLCR